MDSVLLDTNIILDLLSMTRPHHAEAQSFLERALEDNRYRIVLPASSLKDAYYILHRHYSSEEWARDDIRTIRELFTVADLTDSAVGTALVSDEPDFEDGIVRAIAEEQGCKAIVSRDTKAFANSPIPRRLPEEL